MQKDFQKFSVDPIIDMKKGFKMESKTEEKTKEEDLRKQEIHGEKNL